MTSEFRPELEQLNRQLDFFISVNLLFTLKLANYV